MVWALIVFVLLGGALGYEHVTTARTLKELREDVTQYSQHSEEFWASMPKAEVESEPVVHYLAVAKVELDSNENQCRPGDERDIVITVSGEHDAPTGEVHLYDNGTASRASRRLENGVASFHVTFPLRSRHTFTARYSGDSVYEAQPESNSLLLVVI